MYKKKKKIVVRDGEVVGILNCAGKMVSVVDGVAVETVADKDEVISSPCLYKKYYDTHYGDITRQEIQDVADRNSDQIKKAIHHR